MPPGKAFLQGAPTHALKGTGMNWQISKLTVDVYSGQATMTVESVPTPTQNLVLTFIMPEMAKPKPRAAQTLDNVSRAALIAQAKKVLTDASNSLGS